MLLLNGLKTSLILSRRPREWQLLLILLLQHCNLKGIAIFLQRTKVYSTSEELEQNCEKCKEFVAFYRHHLVKTENSVIGQKFVSPKMHYLEDHIPDFAMRWGGGWIIW